MKPHPHKMGVSLAEARRILKTEGTYHSGWGRVSLQPFIVSRRNAQSEWPAEDKELIQKAQLQHDAGTVDMCQGRDGDWIIQYAIPRRIPSQRQPYFTGGRA